MWGSYNPVQIFIVNVSNLSINFVGLKFDEVVTGVNTSSAPADTHTPEITKNETV